MSIFNPKKKNKNEEALNNHKIDIYNPISDDFKNNHNIKTNSHIEITTERKKLDVKKESQNTEINNTSVDLNSNYGGENIEIKNLYNFKSHLSELKYIMNSKADTTISKEIKNSEKGDNKKDLNNNIDINIDEKNDENDIKNKNEISNDSHIINQINEQNFWGNDDYRFSNRDNIRNMSLNELLFFKDSLYEYQFALMERNETYRTKILYNKTECNLLIVREYLYILKIEENINVKKEKNINNPDLSLIYQLEKEEKNQEIEDNLKTTYELCHPLICINFNMLSCKLLLNKNDINNKEKDLYEIQIIILGTKVKILFYIKNYEQYKTFSYIIGQKIFLSEGNKVNKMGLCLRNKDFYKDTYISTSEFESIAKTGDMLLFITMDCISDIQRVFTRDQYDHIALVIIKDGEIEILEATSNEKCSLMEWRKFKFCLFNLIFKKIVLRRLNIEEKDPNKVREIRKNIDEKTKTFIEKIHKKEYEMSLLKMAFSRKPEQYEIDGEWEKGTGYCCSALNAAFYVYCGIMKLEKSVHSVRPGDFEQDKNRLTLLPGFSFGPEKIIEFST